MAQRTPDLRGQRYDTTSFEGKLFLGGLDSRTSKETLLEYCSPWWVHFARAQKREKWKCFDIFFVTNLHG
jgi:hypothetical protein